MTTIIEQLFAEMQEAREAKCAAEYRADQAEYEIFVRAKYSTQDKKDMLAAGHAMPNASGAPSYPVKDAEDLKNAIAAVGRGSADHDDIRAHIIKRAKALGLTSLIPDNWDMTTGAMKPDATQSNGAEGGDETRGGLADAPGDTKQCPTCDGDGKIMAGHRTCLDCSGSGKVPTDFETKSATVPVATWVDELTAETVRNANHEPDYRDVPEDSEDRVNARREEVLIAEILSLPEEQREEMIEAAPEPQQIRDALNSYNDIETAVGSALSAAYGNGNDYCDLWVRDAGDVSDGTKWAVFQSYIDPPGNGTYKVTFNCADDGSISFTSNPVAVSQVTTYEAIPPAPAPDLMAQRDADEAAEAEAIKRDADAMELEREAEQESEFRLGDIIAEVRSDKRSK